MRHIYFLIFILIFASCQSDKNNSVDIDNTKGPSFGQNDSIYFVKKILHGNWYQSDYIIDVKRSLSPFKSQHALGSIVEINVDTNKIRGDSLEVGAPSIHEGYSFMTFFRPGFGYSMPTSMEDYENKDHHYRMTFEIQNSDTSLVLQEFNKSGKLVNRQLFLHAPSADESALQYMVNKTLFAGSFLATDSVGRQHNVHFENNGKVTDFPPYSKYYIVTDFVAGPDNTVDQICFDLHTEKQRCFAFIISGDTTKLFETKEAGDDNDYKQTIGTLKYILTKRK